MRQFFNETVELIQLAGVEGVWRLVGLLGGIFGKW